MEQQEIVSSKNACQQKFTQQCTVKAKKKPRWGWKSTLSFKNVKKLFELTCGDLKFDLQSQFSMSKINQSPTKKLFD